MVDVAGSRDGRGDTRLDRPHDLEDSLPISHEGVDTIADADLRRGLSREPVDEDVAAVAQPSRKWPRLHDADRTQPAVDSCLIGSAGLSHAS